MRKDIDDDTQGYLSDYPKREWVGLTDEEYQEILILHQDNGLLSFYNLIEAKLKELNT